MMPAELRKMSRRNWLETTAGGLLGMSLLNERVAGVERTFQIATFSVDITVPLGHPLCGGWIKPAEVIETPLEGLGIILTGSDKPIVLMVLDWCELNNEANLQWRSAIAEVVGTDTEHVAVQCVHPHNAPLADVTTESILQERFHQEQGLDLEFFRELIRKVGDSAKESLKNSQALTHIGLGKAEVHEVASNRRIIGDDGKVKLWRGSSSQDPAAKSEPEGLVDPFLRTVSFWNGDRAVAALSYYATHPMSYYGDGRVTPDFTGLARMQRQREMPEVFQMYFNGCGGNVAAGKYNDGSPAARKELTEKIHNAMVRAWDATKKHPMTSCSWKNIPIHLDPRRDPIFQESTNRELLAKAELQEGKIDGNTGHAAMRLAWLSRKDRPIDLTCLDLGAAQILHLPGEPFVEYQLFAQTRKEDGFVCVAGYGDGGPGYIPVAKSYNEGGYEAGIVAYTGPGTEEILKQGISELLQ